MIHKHYQVIDWLRDATCNKDRVVYHALNNHQHNPIVEWDGEKFVVTATGMSGREYQVGISLHPVTREPQGFYRLPDEDEEHCSAAIAL